MKVEQYIPLLVLGILVGTFGRVYYNLVQHNTIISEFEIKCTEKGGIMYIPKGVHGWPEPECRNPDYLL